MYDESADILGIKATRNFTYHETIELVKLPRLVEAVDFIGGVPFISPLV